MIVRRSMLELFAGTGTVAKAFCRLGWDTVTVDTNGKCDITCDIRDFHPGRAFDFVWASPPCTEYANTSFPWSKSFGKTPSNELAEHAVRVIRECAPAAWAIENVKGSVPHLTRLLGMQPQSFGPVRLWHSLPVRIVATVKPWKDRLPSRAKEARAQIPAALAAAVAAAVDEHVRGCVWECSA